MEPPPKQLDDANVLFWALCAQATPTGKTSHYRDGQLQPPASALAICQYPHDNGFYLFYCDQDWKVCNDTWHDSVDSAKRQAEFEYDGVSAFWKVGDPR